MACRRTRCWTSESPPCRGDGGSVEVVVFVGVVQDGVGVAQRAQAVGEVGGQQERVLAEQVDVAVAERGEPGGVLVADLGTVGAQLPEHGIEVAGVEQHHRVEHQAQGADLGLVRDLRITGMAHRM
ncbi:hypothetical protein DMP23_43090 [Amycolatopsis sp. A1MSW2902]